MKMASRRPRDVERSSSLQDGREFGSLSKKRRHTPNKRSVRALGNVVATEPAVLSQDFSPVRLISVKRLDYSYPPKAPAEINTYPRRGYSDFSPEKKKRPVLMMENGGLQAEVPPPADAVSKASTQNGVTASSEVVTTSQEVVTTSQYGESVQKVEQNNLDNSEGTVHDQVPLPQSPDGVPTPIYAEIADLQAQIPVEAVQASELQSTPINHTGEPITDPKPSTDGEEGALPENPSQTYESREIQSSTHSKSVIQSDTHTEVRVKETKEVTLEEVQCTETRRPISGTDFSGALDIEGGEVSSSEVTVSEFSRVEVKREEIVDGEKHIEESVSEQTKKEETLEGPKINIDDGQPQQIIIETDQENTSPFVEQPPSPSPTQEQAQSVETQPVKVEIIEVEPPTEEGENSQTTDASRSPPQKHKGIFSGFFTRISHKDKEKEKEKEDTADGPVEEPVEEKHHTKEKDHPKEKGFFSRLSHKDKEKEKEEKSEEKSEDTKEKGFFSLFSNRDKEKDKDGHTEGKVEEAKEAGENKQGTPKKKKRGILKKFSSKTTRDKKDADKKKAAKEAEEGDQSSPGTEPATPDLDRTSRVSEPETQDIQEDQVISQKASEAEHSPGEPFVSTSVEVVHLQSGSDSDQKADLSYPIETEVHIQEQEQSPPSPQAEMSVSTPDGAHVDHREILITEDRPKSLTLPADKRKMVEPQPGTSNTLKPNQSPENSFDHGVVAGRSGRSSVDSGTSSDPARPPGHFVVVAIDFGTTFSGYAFSFTRDADSIHMMRKWEGGDPGVINQKTPTSLLLTPEGKFHSFGFNARDFFHDLDPQESKKWLYFEKFKMALHYSADLNKDTMLKASNGKLVPALTVFSHALRFFKEHALQELSDQSSTKILNEDVRWVITVPAIWNAPAKHFMRTAAYQAGIASVEYPDQLLIALEPEAASIYVRKLRLHQLVPEKPPQKRTLKLTPRKEGDLSSSEPLNLDHISEDFTPDDVQEVTIQIPVNQPNVYPLNSPDTVAQEVEIAGMRYMVVDCGGGTVDITVHEMDAHLGKLKEMYKATGGPYGSVGVDIEFEKLLVDIFGADFIESYKFKRPAGWVDLMIAFESRKRAASPFKNNPLNVSLPFSFIDYHKKYRGNQVESAIRKYGDRDIRWSSQGMLRLNPDAMRRLFLPTLEGIRQAIGDVLNNPEVQNIHFMFLVGGFAESPVLQFDVRREFGHLLKILIPQDVSLTILKGAVCFGLDPTVVKVRKSRQTYGVGVLNRFAHGKHPKKKLVHRDGIDWCTDVFDKFVVTDQSVALGDTVLRSYTPAKSGQKSSIIHIYCSDNSKAKFITDKGVRKIGTLCMDLSDMEYTGTLSRRREIQTRMIFGDTEIRVTALDVATGKCVKSNIDFLNK